MKKTHSGHGFLLEGKSYFLNRIIRQMLEIKYDS